MLTIVQKVQWQESRRMLRVAFDGDLRAREAVCDIQYGYIRRVTHRNTSWELARFEYPIHRYIDLGDERQAMAVLNDCKYGAIATADRIDLALLKSPKYPDWTADQGEHEFGYALLPHAGDGELTGVMNAAAVFNRMPLAMAGNWAAEWHLPCRIVSENIRLEVIKKAEKSDDLILRVVECAGRYSQGKLVLSEKYALYPCDLLEWEEQEDALEVDAEHCRELAMKPFEIGTYRLKKRQTR